MQMIWFEFIWIIRKLFYSERVKPEGEGRRRVVRAGEVETYTISND